LVKEVGARVRIHLMNAPDKSPRHQNLKKKSLPLSDRKKNKERELRENGTRTKWRAGDNNTLRRSEDREKGKKTGGDRLKEKEQRNPGANSD